MPATVVNSVSVNTEGSLFAAALSTGLRVLNMEPLVVKRVLDRTVLGGGSVRLCALLHRTNLIALVGGNGNGNGGDPDQSSNIVDEEGCCSKWSDRRVLVWDDALRRFVLEFTFASPVLALRTTRERLFVVERAQITAFTFPGHLGHPGPVRRLFTVETRDNGRGLCEVTPVTAAAAAAALHLLVFPGHKCGSVQLVNHLSMIGNCLSTTTAGANCLSSSTAPASFPSSQFGTKNGTTSTVNKVIAGDEPKLAGKKTDYSASTNGENKNGASEKDFLFDSDDGENEEDGQTNFWKSDSLEISEEEEEEDIDCDESGEKLNGDTAGDAENLKKHHHYQQQLPSPVTDINKSASVSISPTTLSAHQTEVACLALNRRGTLLATASQKGTLIRVFRTSTTSSSSSEGVYSTSSSSSEINSASSSPYTAPLAPTLLTELRRGLDVATVYCIAFSADDAFLLASSDKGTVHIFALKEGRLNRRSSLYNVVGPCFSQHLTALAGVTGAAAYSLARFTLPAECACVATFGTSGSLGTSGPGSGSAGRRRSVYAVCVDGSYHKYVFSADGSSCEREVYDHYLDAPDEEETMFL